MRLGQRMRRNWAQGQSLGVSHVVGYISCGCITRGVPRLGDVFSVRARGKKEMYFFCFLWVSGPGISDEPWWRWLLSVLQSISAKHRFACMSLTLVLHHIFWSAVQLTRTPLLFPHRSDVWSSATMFATHLVFLPTRSVVLVGPALGLGFWEWGAFFQITPLQGGAVPFCGGEAPNILKPSDTSGSLGLGMWLGPCSGFVHGLCEFCRWH